jgi:propionaldehyde dehydrogenase
MSKDYLGVFENVEDAIEAAVTAQKQLMCSYDIGQRQAMIENVRKYALDNLDVICRREVTETGYGRYEDKIEKNWGSFLWTPDTRDVPEKTYCGSKGLTVEYYAPFGIIGAVTPVTNPAATIVSNSICNLAVGNGVVFNPHPAAPDSAAHTTDLVNRAIVQAGGPANLYTITSRPTLRTLDVIMRHPAIRLLLGTGGPAMVAGLMASGKKVIAAGPGNPPSIIDSSADLPTAALNLTMSSSFDNNVLCVGEKEAFVLDDIFDAFMDEMKKAMQDEHKRDADQLIRDVVGRDVASRDYTFRNVCLTREEADRLVDICLSPPGESGSEWTVNRQFVGKDASVILEAAGISFEGDPRLAFFEAPNDHPFVQIEQMMPVFPLVRCRDFDEAVDRAVFAEHDNRHSASIWTKDLFHATQFGKRINTTVYVMNGRTFAAFGLGGEGSNSPTIATPTGEGVTGPQSFARKRRFSMAGGQGYII